MGKDVAVALGYKDTVNALKAHVDEEDKAGWQITTPRKS
ncbi:BRO family protein [Hallella absiana]